ncbi:DUF6345 domain-containing protein [Myxococcus qinghaiensis]|uniref:DUF6345 domain-containing protein n=1 Tax=Myxococcus qinghaiensis TaxID=2906758 RepID=UPI0020A7F78A|nr:DUF6345 domain-containing protein [Myxococcus qinghaiensis]MCP3165606.1 DUF6345 domain-containing protein [Myxococcus qinghaiensis]
MKFRTHTKQWLSSALAGALLLPAAALANETHVYGIANFGGAGQCSGSSHSVHTQTAATFANYFNLLRSLGLWSDVRTHNNSNAARDLWTDPAKGAVGESNDAAINAGVDDADVIFVHTHGSHSASTPRSSLVMGSNDPSCSARTNEHMRLGNGKLDIAVIKACQSGNIEVWEKGGYRQQLVTATSGFSVWNAFHGDSSCGNFVKGYLEDYTANSMADGVGENWIDEAYDWGLIYDDCPVSIVFGDTKAKRKSMYEAGGWRDRKNTGSKTGSTYFYVSGCNPDNGRKLP